MKSSTKPTRPSPVIKKRTSIPLALGGVSRARWDAVYPAIDGDDDDGAAHGGRPTLDVVRGRAVVADQLPVALGDEDADGDAGAEQGHQKGGARTDEKADHRRLPWRAQQGVGDGLEPHQPRALDQHDISGRHLVGQHRDGRVPVGHPDRLASPRALVRGTEVDRASALTDGDQPVDVEADGQPTDGVVLERRGVAELAHLAQHRPAGPVAGHADQGLQGGPHRLGVRVVGVVDHRDAVGAFGHLHTPP